MTREAMTQMLRREMVSALGCTGPTAYALAAACCRPHLTGEVTGMDVYVSPAILKIVFGVATPGTPEPGIAIASAIGLLGGDMTRGLEVLESAGPEDVKRAHEMVEEGKVRVLCDWEQTGVYVRAEVQTHKERVAAVVAGTHDGIQGVWVDGRPVLENPPASEELTEEEAGLNLEMIFDYVEHCRPGELRFLLEGYRMNAALAEDGLKQPFGLCSGRAHLRDTFPAGQIPEDLFQRPLDYLPASLAEKVRVMVSAASDARMGGSRMPAMAAMGDGNQGITATLPVGLAAEHLGASEEETIRALAMSCLMLFYVKIHTGRAAAFCLCAIAAAAGVAAGVGYLKGLTQAQIRAAVKNVMAPLAGMLCDGAKNACALKMSIAAASALSAVELAAAGVEAGYYDGVADYTLEQTVSCITRIGTAAQELLDRCMVEEILAKQAREAGAP